MSSPSPSNVEEDAWLMKIELKREEPEEANKEEKDKKATVDHLPEGDQFMPAKEGEEEDIL